MRALLPLALFAFALPALADAGSPVGLWQSIDDHTGRPKAEIRISEANGVLQGRIEKLYRPAGTDPNPACARCEGANQGKPIVGLAIINGMKQDGDGYAGGTILDPENGKVYKSTMKLSDGGKKLEVRGYVGMPAFGRSQTWVRHD
ncbi:uncharacterized protein (DUF2147 family) [Pseudoduganella lurida]|uniref:Uncharacterized protein (DUF2147 family) n=1 Tax=Pseudoduganella lurida TaxID=1036180 RepID=A0A562R3I9_9BURK|nr:DUF2147 domain-containing protein [Pseudoduganella lurida]TWI63628.1 uncharacterized protein (DUF2147 family) [Pseudoduganella lurida]